MATYGTFVDGQTLTASEANDFLEWKTFPTAVLYQPSQVLVSGSGSEAVSAWYAVVNKTVYYHVRLTCNGGSGTANTRIEVNLPVTAAANSVRVIGTGSAYDSLSPSAGYRLAVVRVSTTRVAFLANASASLTTYLGQTNGPTLTLADNDMISFTCVYEAA